MPTIKAILFDLGNTLMYFDGVWTEVFAQADQELSNTLIDSGLLINKAEFLTKFRSRLNAYFIQRESEFIEHTTAYLLRNLLAESGYEDVPDDVLFPALKRMYKVSQSHWIPEDDALPTLESLQKNNYKLGIISNASDDNDVQTLVDKTQLRPYIDFVLTSAAYGIRKPNPRIFQSALDNWGLPPENVAMVGDTLGADILGAKNSKIFSIWITKRADAPGNRDHADTITPDATIDSLSELPDLLRNLKLEINPLNI